MVSDHPAIRNCHIKNCLGFENSTGFLVRRYGEFFFFVEEREAIEWNQYWYWHLKILVGFFVIVVVVVGHCR